METVGNALRPLVQKLTGFTPFLGENKNDDVKIREMDPEMLIIGSSWGRTGTSSLQKALQILGYPCYHMREAFRNDDFEMWGNLGKQKMAKKAENIANGDTETPWKNTMIQHEWNEVFRDRGYLAHADEPACAFYKELLEYYPKAKVIHNVRDAERWYDSAIATIMSINMTLNERWLSRLFFSKFNRLYWNCVADYLFDGRLRDKEFVMKRYNDWNEEVIKSVPKDRLLLLNLKEGWEPLCKFLGIDEIPDEPFPYVNERALFEGVLWKLNLVFDFINVGLVVTPIAIGYYYRDSDVVKRAIDAVVSLFSR